MSRQNVVKGLLLYRLYASSGNILMMFGISFVCGCIVLASGNFVFFSGFIGISLISASCSLIISKKDNVCNWNKYQLAMRVKRKDVITSYYVGHILMLLLAFSFTGILTVLMCTFHQALGNEILRRGIYLFTICISTSLITCGLYYPFYFTVGENKAEALNVVIIFPAVAIALFFFWIGKLFDLSDIILAICSFVMSMIIFLVSYWITIQIYAKKDM